MFEILNEIYVFSLERFFNKNRIVSIEFVIKKKKLKKSKNLTKKRCIRCLNLLHRKDTIPFKEFGDI